MARTWRAVRRSVLAGFGLVLGALSPARGGDPPVPPSLLVIVIDAQRADHLSSYGYGRPTTPGLDALAARGVRFTNAIAASNRTGTSMASFWTGQLPSRHGVFRTGDVLGERFVTLAELLSRRGYRTGAWCPNPSLDRAFGHAQGWQTYDDHILSRAETDGRPAWQRWETAQAINARALEWITAEPGRPFLAWLHYRDVHGPYVPPPPYDVMFPPLFARPLRADEIAARPVYLTLPDDGNDLQHYVSQYDGDVRYADEKIAELLAELERRGVLRNTVVVVTADHGEAFLDHGQWNHDASLYEEEVRVPLLVVRPAGGARVVSRVVSALDLFPTFLALAGAPQVPSDGESLLPLLDGDDARYQRRRAYVESRAPYRAIQRAVREERWKAIVNDSLVARLFGSPLELYDLAADPGERRSLAGSESARAAEMAAGIRAAVAAPVAPAADGGPVAADVSRRVVEPELQRRLESLGYVD